MFEEGQEYHRRTDIHAKFGGQEQGGISTPAMFPYVFLFYADSGKDYGYSDGWLDATYFHYTGHGQRGDMELSRGNLAIRDHAKNGKAIHLFRKVRAGFYRYEGELEYVTHMLVERVPDADGHSRSALVFTLQRA